MTGYGFAQKTSHVLKTEYHEASSKVVVLCLLHLGDWIWTGLQDFVVEGEYHWATSNDRASYTNWQSPAEPDDQKHAEDCVILHANNGLWWDYNCEQRCTFVCEQA